MTGALTAQCVGVSKTAVCKLIQRDDVTFTLSVRPQETGRHMLTIKFNNEHVPGRHFTILVVTHTHTHTHTRLTALFSGTTRVGRYQKGKTNQDFTEARDSEWQWHHLGRMQVCTSLQTDNHTSTSPLSFLQAGCPSCRPTNSVKALKVRVYITTRLRMTKCSVYCTGKISSRPTHTENTSYH